MLRRHLASRATSIALQDREEIPIRRHLLGGASSKPRFHVSRQSHLPNCELSKVKHGDLKKVPSADPQIFPVQT